jgi:uncharacterized protein (TIGR03086 family)
MDLNTLYHRTVESWADRVNEVRADQWEGPTPCREWNVRELVNHVTGEDLWTTPLMRGSTLEDVGSRFDGDLLGDDPIRASLAAAREAIRTVAESLPTRGTVHLSYGEEQMDEYVHQLAADHLVHAWDLARALGVDDTLDPEAVHAVAEWFEPTEELWREAGVIGPRVPVPDDADEQTRMLAMFGRAV